MIEDNAAAAATAPSSSSPPSPLKTPSMTRTSSLNNNSASFQVHLGGLSPDSSAAPSQMCTSLVLSLRSLQLYECQQLYYSLEDARRSLRNPLLAYIESFPFAWDGKALRISSYQDFVKDLSTRTTHLQAVITRRLNSIGVLQSHVLRATWAKGVTGWGVLGAAEMFCGGAGGDWDWDWWLYGGGRGRGRGRGRGSRGRGRTETDRGFGGQDERPGDGQGGDEDLLALGVKNWGGGSLLRMGWAWCARGARRTWNIFWGLYYSNNLLGHSFISQTPQGLFEPLLQSISSQGLDCPSPAASRTTSSDIDDGPRSKKFRAQRPNSAIEVPVLASINPTIEIDQSVLASWSIDAVRLVRHQLQRAGGGVLPPLPHGSNWGEGASPEAVWDLDVINESCPRWATEWAEESGEMAVRITDTRAMRAEIDSLFDCMGRYMRAQRARRLDKLSPPSHWRRRWLYPAVGIPTVLFGLYQALKYKSAMKAVVERVLAKLSNFYADHVEDPINYLYTEFFTSKVRDKITDRAALQETRDALKRMLHAWHLESFPAMKDEERISRSENMDVSLIEEQFEKGVTSNTIKNIVTGDIVRMALIELQFIKKELLTAMGAIDDLMEANEFNIRVGSMVPAGVGLWMIRKVVKTAYYFLMPGAGKSKKETFASFRSIILDIERLLVMRDDPPPPPRRLKVGKYKERRRGASVEKEPIIGLSFDDGHNARGSAEGGAGTSEVVLNENDWGMVVLLLHEAQTLLWREQRRFLKGDFPNIFEDLAEIAGERGPVSVKQQLAIVRRMNRTYGFLG